MSLDPTIPIQRRYPARRPLTWIVCVYDLAVGIVWWVSSDVRARNPTFRSLRRAGELLPVLHLRHGMWLWAALFTAVALLLLFCFARGGRTRFVEALGASFLLNMVYLAGQGVSSLMQPAVPAIEVVHGPHGPITMALPGPTLAFIPAMILLAGMHLTAIYLTARDA